MDLRRAWQEVADEWLAWSRTPGHDSYWQFHRDAFLRLVPPAGPLTLDVGCGEGRLGRDLARLGHRVLGVDASETLARATSTHSDFRGWAVVADAAALPLPDGAASLVVALLSLQDIDAFEAAIGEAGRVLRSDGVFLMAIVHPVNSAGTLLSRDPDALRFVITDSWFERRRRADDVSRDGLHMTFHSEHRPLQAYTDALADAGLLIERLAEVTDPRPDDPWHNFPMFLHIRAVKPASKRVRQASP